VGSRAFLVYREFLVCLTRASPVFRVCPSWAVSWVESSTLSVASFRLFRVFRRCRVFPVASFRVFRGFLISVVWSGMLSTLSRASCRACRVFRRCRVFLVVRFRLFRVWVTSLTSSVV
jgi:hypothetical protein